MWGQKAARSYQFAQADALDCEPCTLRLEGWLSSILATQHINQPAARRSAGIAKARQLKHSMTTNEKLTQRSFKLDAGALGCKTMLRQLHLLSSGSDTTHMGVGPIQTCATGHEVIKYLTDDFPAVTGLKWPLFCRSD